MALAESRLLEEDKDAWFFQSLKRYTNLYMFDLEFPLEAIEVIDDTSICLSGIQNYSRKCEFLQMSIPPKLLSRDLEEGLCKDRDFKIISGGYASSKVIQIKGLKSVKDFVVTRQENQDGITLFKLGNDDHAVIKEIGTFSHLKEKSEETAAGEGLGPIDTSNTGRLAAGSFDGKYIYEWAFSSSEETFNRGSKHNVLENGNWGKIAKIKFWDDNTVTFITNKGTVCIKDLREGEDGKPTSSFHATKSPFAVQGSSEGPNNVLFSLDVLPSINKIGIVDSCGGYESADIRFLAGERDRVILPGCAAAPGVLVGRFNIEYQPTAAKENSNSNDIKFIVSGMKQDTVEIYKESFENNSASGDKTESETKLASSMTVTPVFLHDGHSKTVTHALWHPNSERLLFSTSVDSVLHAWQYIEN